MLASIAHDLRHAARGLAARPGLTAVALLTLALGVGATTTLYSVVHGVLLRPLGFADEDRLYSVVAVSRSDGSEGPGNTLPDAAYYREHARSFEALSFLAWHSMTVDRADGVEPLRGVLVGADLFPMLGVEPELGRHFAPEDVAPGRSPAALVSHELWQRLFGGDPGAVGRSLVIDGQSVTVVGVLPPGTAVPAPGAELWQAVGEIDDPYGRFSRQERDFQVLGRLAPEVAPEAAEAELVRLAAQLAEAHPATHEEWTVALRPLSEQVVGRAAAPILVAFAAVVLVLVLACANLAHLLLMRAVGREREMAVRAALGAGRRRLVRQLLTESTALAVAGGALGVLVAAWLVEMLLALEPGILPRTETIRLDAPVLLFALATAVATGLACGAVPALRGSAALAAALREGGDRTTGGGRRQNRWRLLLLGGEVALALVLLAGAGLLIRAFAELRRVDPGFEPAHTYAAFQLLDPETYGELPARRTYYRRLREAVAAIPGVEAAGLTTAPPVPGFGIRMDVPIRGEEGPPLGADAASQAGAPRAAFRVISPGELATLGVPLLQGRDFRDADDESSPLVALVNRALARRLWPNGDPVGRRFEIFVYGERLEYEVIGVAGDTRSAGLHQPPQPALYLTHPQMPFLGIAVVARTRLPAATFERALREAALALDPTRPPKRLYSLEEELARSLGLERFFAALLSLFAALALVLAGAGIYGVFSYAVSQRTREIGLRMALGADAGRVLRRVVGRGLAVTAFGLALGLAGAAALARVLERAFHGVAPLDPAVLGTVAALLGAVALLACWLPARRASRVPPGVALRGE